jgi:hypothetical protein
MTMIQEVVAMFVMQGSSRVEGGRRDRVIVLAGLVSL